MQPFFISECGINHGGSLEYAFQQIETSVLCGANVAKFQMYDPLKLLGPESPYLAYATKCQFTKGQHERLARCCKASGIDYTVSVFEVKDLDWAASLSSFIKIASRMNTNGEFISKALTYNKPVIMSCQSNTDHLAATWLPLKFMWCVPKYPAAVDDYAGFEYSARYGMSSHCPDPKASVFAAHNGARIFENHLTLNRNDEGCDHSSSIEPAEYARMITRIREICK
jgi:sialic acid synthase SpsE